MKDQIKVDNQNNQEKTENIISGVIQKLKKPKVIVLVVLSVILSLGGIFAGVYYRQKQIVTNQEKKTIESQKSNNVLNNTKALPFLEILDTKNQIPVELREEPTAISISSGKGCQPDFFDPQTTKYEYLPQTEKTGSYWAKDIYQIRGNDYNYKFSINTISAPPYTITDYEFGCASSFDHVLDIRKDNKRISLYTHVDTFYLSGDKNLLFLDNYIKSQKGAYDHKRRIISMDGTKKTDIPPLDCVSSGARWTNNNTLVTYSTEPDLQKGEKTKICVWDQNGSLKNRLQAELTWYGAAYDTLWAEIGVLPNDPNIFYAYDNNRTSTPQMCSLFLQDLTDQRRNKTIDLFLEGSDYMPQHLCPWYPNVKFDFSQTTFDSPQLKFKVDIGYKNDKYYKKYIDWQAPPNPPLQSSILYEDDYASFKYPSYLIRGEENIGGSGYSQEFKEENEQYTLTFSVRGNYNQITGKPYATIDEYLDMPYQVKKVTIAGQEGRQPLPRDGSENDFSASFFSKDLEFILTLDLKVSTKHELKTDAGYKMFDQILSTFKFSGTNWGDWQTSTMTKAIQMLQAISEVQNIERTVSHAGRKLFYTPEGVNGDVVRVSLRESFPDDPHTSRIDTFNINIKTKIITVEDVVTEQDISLEEWKKKINQSWGF
jgi:hypothetical protein